MKTLSLGFLASALVLLLGAGCSDDTKSSIADSGKTPDKNGNGTEASTQHDGSSTTDSPASTQDGPKTTPDGAKHKEGSVAKTDAITQFDGNVVLNCAEIGTCSDTCAAGCTGTLPFTCLQNCATDCKAKGCASAKTAFGTLYSCISSTCLMSCYNGPTAACKSCVSSKCTTELTACNAQKC
jgi:hypothetical protein